MSGNKEIQVAVREMVFIDIDELVPFQGDLKTLTEERYLALRQEIIDRKFSFAFHAWANAPDAKKYIGDGHQRHRVLTRMRTEGWTVPKMPVVLIEADDEQQFRLKLLAAVATYGEVDSQGLYEFVELGQIPIGTLENYPLPNLDMDEFKAEYYEPEPKKEDEPPPPPPLVPKTQLGDLWNLGRHRLVCGDSTAAAVVAHLMGPEKADLVFTDPPYGVSYEKKMAQMGARDGKKSHIENDDLDDDKLHAFLAAAFTAWPLKPGGTFYVCSPPGRTEMVFRSSLEETRYELRQVIAWVKDRFVMGRQDYHWRHESILYGWREGAAHYFVDDRTQDTVWEIPRPQVNEEHPTMKPIELVEKAIRNSTLSNGIVYDGFGGSGTTLLAAETTGRSARLIELSPAYCDVILGRFCRATGVDPVRADGVLWSAIQDPKSHPI